MGLAGRGEALSGPVAGTDEGRRRAVIENVTPQVDGGRFPVKRVVGDTLVVEADVFADGHDEVRARLAWSRGGDDGEWQQVEMERARQRPLASALPAGRDRPLRVHGHRLGRPWRTWVHDLRKRLDAGQDVNRRSADRRPHRGRSRDPCHGSRSRDASQPGEPEPDRAGGAR